MISPDGTKLAYLAPDDREVLQIWLCTLGAADDRCISSARRPISNHWWSWDSRSIFWAEDNDGDENWHILSIDPATLNIRDLTPWQGVRCHYTISRVGRPGEILALLNVRNRKLMDVWRIDLLTGAAKLEVENPGNVSRWLADDDLVVRASFGHTPEGGSEVQVRADAAAPWRVLIRSAPDEEAEPLAFSKNRREIYLRTSVGSDTLRLVGIDPESGRERQIAATDDFDVENVMLHPTRRTVEAVSFAPDRMQWQAIDPAVAGDFEQLEKIEDGMLHVTSRDLDDRKWVVSFAAPNRPVHYYLWDRVAKSSMFLFSHRPELETATLSEMQPTKYTARDGLEIRGYLTLPPGVEPRNLPLVLHPHGGPWARDYWTLNVWVQLLANRGYAVLQPNFRGSTGYGKKFLHAGDREWGRAMQDDLTDAVKWAVGQGIADPNRVAIFGGSYGGYATLAGSTFTPDLYNCAVDLCGPSNLATLIKSFAPYWGIRSIWNARVGNPDDPSDQELLRKASPLFAVDKIKVPMLIAQGTNDVRVIQSESDQIVAAIENKGGTVTYVVYPDEGHTGWCPQNSKDFVARTEKFLAEHLGGRYEPMEGERIEGSSAAVKVIHSSSAGRGGDSASGMR